MVSLDRVRDWLAEHGYRDKIPRRDAINPAVMYYTFVHRDDMKRIGVRFLNGAVKDKRFEAIKRVVRHDEQGKPPSSNP